MANVTLAESGFAQSLGEQADLVVLAGLTDVRRADRAVWRSLDRIGARLDEARVRPRIASEVRHASDSDDEIRCIVLTGAGGNFSSGADLRAMAGDPDDDGDPALPDRAVL